MNKKYITAITATILFCSSCGHNHHEAHSHDEHEHTDMHIEETEGVKCDSHEHEHEHKEEEHDHPSGTVTMDHDKIHKAGIECDTVRKGSFKLTVKTCGTILAAQNDETIISSPTDGIIALSSSNIVEGKSIQAHEKIALISSSDIKNGDPYVKAVANYNTAKSKLERIKTLADDKIISKNDLEIAQKEYEIAESEYKALANKRSSGSTSVASPCSGYIKQLFVNNGQYISAGDAIASVTKNKRMQIKIDVPEKYANEIRNLTKVNIKLPYHNEIISSDNLNGKLISVNKFNNGSSFITAIYEFDNLKNITQGTIAEVYLIFKNKPSSISVPKAAVVESSGLHFVYIQQDHTCYTKQEVKTGDCDGENIEVICGLKDGDVIATKGSIHIKLEENASIIPEGHNHNH